MVTPNPLRLNDSDFQDFSDGLRAKIREAGLDPNNPRDIFFVIQDQYFLITDFPASRQAADDQKLVLLREAEVGQADQLAKTRAEIARLEGRP